MDAHASTRTVYVTLTDACGESATLQRIRLQDGPRETNVFRLQKQVINVERVVTDHKMCLWLRQFIFYGCIEHQNPGQTSSWTVS